MAKIININYFNTVILKFDKTANEGGECHIEESRIKGDFNEVSIGFGSKAYITNSDFTEETIEDELLASGLYNESTGVNNTNQFSLANSIKKDISNNKGSIQKLFAEDTNLLIFQEEKTSFVLLNKNAIFTAQGGNLTSSTSEFFGQVSSYAGDYGIATNPESFAYYAGRKYFADKSKGLILRLSRDGITELSSYGMRSFFRNNLKKANKIYGMWDIHDKKYIVHAEGENLITNGDFSNGTTNWTFTDDTSGSGAVSVVGGVVVFNTANDDIVSINQVGVMEVGKTYRLQYEITALTSGELRVPRLGVNDDNGATLPVTVGYHSVELQAYATELKIKRQTHPVSLSIDNISLTEVDNAMDNLASTTTMPNNVNSFTIGFDEGSRGWISFYTFFPKGGGSIDGDFYTFSSATSHVWKQYSNNTRNSFYGASSADSSIDFVFNQGPSTSKNFLTLNYEGADTWNISNIASETDTGADVAAYNVSNQDLIISGFQKAHNKYFSNIINLSSSAINEVVFGESISGIKGFFMKLKVKTSASSLKELYAISTNYNVNSY